MGFRNYLSLFFQHWAYVALCLAFERVPEIQSQVFMLAHTVGALPSEQPHSHICHIMIEICCCLDLGYPLKIQVLKICPPEFPHREV